jgi:signal transduction histidine kinase
LSAQRTPLWAAARALFGVYCCTFAVGALVGPTPAHAQAAPFVVQRSGAGAVVVERSLPDGSRAEGFVIDEAALVATLRTRVLTQQGLGNLAHVTAAVEPTGKRYRDLSQDIGWSTAYSFRHSFAPPFSVLSAQLDLAPLDDADSFGLLYQLTAWLALAVVLGLYAMYRTVAVQLRFAERRSNFVAAVSHELKTPLTAIRMYAEMLRDDLVDNDHKRKEYYATITAETERLSRLINNVLEFSRIERGEGPLPTSVGDVSAVVRDVVEAFRPHLEREGFRIELRCERPLPAARFHRDALTQVLFNLLDNALKYGRGGAERLIEVRCEPAPEGAGVQLVVADRGPGVPASQLALIFEPFYRAQSELTRTQTGTGLGLALVQGLVTRMQGRVEGRNLAAGFEVCVTLRVA